MFAPILVAEILFTFIDMFPLDVIGVLAIVNSEPDCVSPMLVTVPVFEGVTCV